MYSHTTVGTNDLVKAERFYDAVMAALGHAQFFKTEHSVRAKSYLSCRPSTKNRRERATAYTLRSKWIIAPKSTHSMQPPWPTAEPTRVRRDCGLIIIPTTTPRTCAIRMAIRFKRCVIERTVKYRFIAYRQQFSR